MIRATVTLLALATFPGKPGMGQVATAPAARSALREALLNRDRATSDAVRRDGLARGLAPAFDPEVLLLLEGAPLVAERAAAVRLLEQRAELAALRVQWLPLAVLVSLDGTMGMTYGMTAIADTAGDTTRLRFGKYISVWRRRDGAWHLAAHLQTGLLPRDAPVPGAAPSLAPAAAQLTTGPGAAFAGADRAFARMAADSGAPAAFAAFAAPTAVTFAATGDLVIGPGAIRARMMENHARTSWSWAPLFAGSSADGDLGYTVGEATIANTDGEPWTFFGKYLTIWRRMADGSVRFVVDGGNARPPAR